MELSVQPREQFGRAVKTLQKQGLIPAELYGHGVENLHLAVSAKEFEKIFKEAGENTVVNLLFRGERRAALIHDVQEDYLSGKVRHIDFYQVRMDEKIKAKIPLEFSGEAPAVKNLGGVLNKSMSEIEVESLPGDLPHRFEVDLFPLQELNQSIHVRDIRVPKGVRVLVDSETVVVTVTPPMKEEEVAPPPAAVDVSAVKVETEEKKSEREKGKAEEQEKPAK